jgi:hypothetical protein
MGFYQGELFVPFVPMMLSKLYVQVTISTMVERLFNSLTVRLGRGVNPLAVIEVPVHDFVRFVMPANADAFQWSVNVGVMLSPFTITEPGELRVGVITREGEMLGSICVLKCPLHIGDRQSIEPSLQFLPMQWPAGQVTLHHITAQARDYFALGLSLNTFSDHNQIQAMAHFGHGADQLLRAGRLV